MKEQVHGGNIYKYGDCIDFSANCNPLGTPEGVKQAIIRSLDRLGNYPQVGSERLKEAIGAYEGVTKDQIICGNGAAELIFSLCRGLKPKKALLPAPTFAEYEQALKSVDCGIRYFYLPESQQFALGESFLDELKDDVDVVFLCNPNNPTGMLTDPALMERVLDTCQKKKIFLVVDECFLDFVEEPEKHTLKKRVSDCKELFLLKAFTKRYAMASVRLGYGISGNQELLDTMEAMTQPWNVSGIAQEAGIAALKEELYVEESRKQIFAEKKFLAEEMEKLGLTVYPSKANYLFFQGPEELFSECVKRGILIRDCSNYEGLGKGFYRIAVKLHEDNRKLLQVLEEILNI